MNVSEVITSEIVTDEFTSTNVDILVGIVTYFYATTAPDGWLLCNGSNISRTTYANLFNKIGTSYGAGDGSSTFSLPDFRGSFLRCHNQGNTTYDPDGSGRSVGSFQSYAIINMWGHTPAFQNDYWRTGEYGQGVMVIQQFWGSTDGGGGSDACSKSYYDSNRQANGSNNEGRPINIALAAYIKY